MVSGTARPEILSFGDLVRSGSYDVHSRFRRVVNLTNGTRFVSLVAPGVDPGPLSVVVSGFDPSAVRRVRIETRAGRDGNRSRTVVLDGERREIDPARIYDSALPRVSPDAAAFRRNLRRFGSLLVEHAPPASLAYLLSPDRISEFRAGFERGLAEHIMHCVADVLYGDTLRGVSRIRGCGVGLTPSGDDFLMGFLTATHVTDAGRAGLDLRARVLDAARTSNLLSDTFLDLAARGRVSHSVRHLMASLAAGTPDDVTRWTMRLLSVGATSGADTGVGLYVTLRSRFRGVARQEGGRPTGERGSGAWEVSWS